MDLSIFWALFSTAPPKAIRGLLAYCFSYIVTNFDRRRGHSIPHKSELQALPISIAHLSDRNPNPASHRMPKSNPDHGLQQELADRRDFGEHTPRTPDGFLHLNHSLVHQTQALPAAYEAPRISLAFDTPHQKGFYNSYLLTTRLFDRNSAQAHRDFHSTPESMSSQGIFPPFHSE